LNKLLISIILFTTIIVAQNQKVYIDIDSAWLSYKSKGVSSNFRPMGVKWTAGYKLKDFYFASVAIEGSALIGVENSTKSSLKNSSGTFTNAEVFVDKIYSLQLKNIFPLNQSFNANFHIGGTTGKINSSSNQSKSNSSFERSLSYGASLEYWSKENISLHVGYMQYFKNLSAIETGIGFQF